MSLNTIKFKTDLLALFQAQQQGTGTASQNLEAFIDGYVSAHAEFVKSASIVYEGGLTSTDGPVTGEFNGELQ